MFFVVYFIDSIQVKNKKKFKDYMQQYFSNNEIKKISKKISKWINWTPLYFGEKFSKQVGNNIYFKLENLQKTGSFKLRGALNKINSLSSAERKKGIIAASAGNHAQGVAFAANLFKIQPTIVMPILAPIAKIKATEEYGGNIILHGNFFDDCLEKAQEISKNQNMTLVHAFDDIDVIKGQATIGYEITHDLETIDYCLVPIGGGGVMSGISHYLKQFNPKIKVIGVEAENVNSFEQALKNKKPISINSQFSIADGIAVKRISDLTYKIMTANVDDVVTVSEDEIAQAMLFLLEKCKFVTEGAGAVVAAAILFDKLNINHQNLNVVGVITGGNVDITTMGNIINNALIQQNRRIVVSVNSPMGNNAIIELGEIVKKNGAIIYKIRSSLDRKNLDLNNVNIKLIIDVSDKWQKQKIIDAIKEKGYKVVSTK